LTPEVKAKFTEKLTLEKSSAAAKKRIFE